MDKFILFLKRSKSLLGTISENTKIHLVLGNESCDLDSSISSLLLGYFHSIQNPENIVVPVLNVSQENFLLRTENCFVFKEAGLDLEHFVYRDQIDFKQLCEKCKLTVSLVDHHILTNNDKILEKYVTEIFDHRPVDSSHVWDTDKVTVRIEPVGSCSTLVTDVILKRKPDILTCPLANLLYQTIIYDTVALRPELGKAKPLDIEVALNLEKTYNFLAKNRQSVCDSLWAVHNDISALSPKQLLYKDMKVIESFYIPGLPILVEDYLKIPEAHRAIVEFAVENKTNCVLLVGLDVTAGKVRRDIGIYSTTKEDRLKAALLNVFDDNPDYDFQFEHRTTAFDDDMYLLHVHNIKLSRKQLVPVVKQACAKYTNL